MGTGGKGEARHSAQKAMGRSVPLSVQGVRGRQDTAPKRRWVAASPYRYRG
uniref:Uncharacterized protein n=1 Tax=viral metagenome TaxID=1070528 RepID=A0A6C0HLK1_9ZZZZ